MGILKNRYRAFVKKACMRTTLTRGDLRDSILDGVDRLLARFGYRKMTMDDVAREAGVARRTIYLYFRSKEEVALSSIDRVVARLLARLREIAGSPGPTDARLREMLVTRILFRFDSVQDYYQSFDELFAELRPIYLSRREEYFAAEAAVFAEVLAEGIGRGVFTCDDVSQTSRDLLRATNSLLPYSLSARELEARADVEATVMRLAGLLLDGLRRREADAG
jgi:AcrR family transcriptional regulator